MYSFGPLTAIVLDRCVTKSTNTILFVKISMNEISNDGGFSKPPWKVHLWQFYIPIREINILYKTNDMLSFYFCFCMIWYYPVLSFTKNIQAFQNSQKAT